MVALANGVELLLLAIGCGQFGIGGAGAAADGRATATAAPIAIIIIVIASYFANRIWGYGWRRSTAIVVVQFVRCGRRRR